MECSFFEKKQHADYRRLDQMLNICKEGIYNGLYYKCFKKIPIKKANTDEARQWLILTKEAYYDNLIRCWCMLFGDYDEPTHYRKLLKNRNIKNKILEILGSRNDDISAKKLKIELLRHAKIDVSQYKKSHSSVLKYRNKYLIHREHDPEIIKDNCIRFPEINFCLELIDTMFLFLIQIIRSYGVSGSEYEIEYPNIYNKSELNKWKKEIKKNLCGISLFR